MNTEEQRIAIAEACGFTDVKKIWVYRSDTGNDGYNVLTGNHECSSNRIDIPDYLNDLNAMHEAEKHLGDPTLYDEYSDNLRRAMDGVGWTWHATAAQRAEAFLKTLNLWKYQN
jgi:hypothetical protein